MSSPVSVSVCMATYNGARFIIEQLRSILDELHPQDEVILVDDASTDDTVGVAEQLKDPRVRVIRQPSNLGYVRTFEHAMSSASGDVLFLADQDDVWIPGRRAVMLHALTRARLVSSNLLILGSGAPLSSPITGRPWRLDVRTSRHYIRNRLRMLLGIAPYYGCAMAMTRDFAELALPFPAFLDESHDLWLAMLANTDHTIVHVSTPTILRRLHDSNASPARPRGISPALRSRWMLLRALRESQRRVRAHKKM